MPHLVLSYPLKRPAFITNVTWVGNPGDQEISLNLEYQDAQGLPAQTTLYSLPAAEATLCLPNGRTIDTVPEDVLTAHARMAGMISGTVPNSEEYAAALKGDGLLNGRNFQSPIGDVKVTDVQSVSANLLRLTFQKSSGGTTRNVDVDVRDLATYAFVPSTQLLVVAGAIKKEFPTYIQDADNNKFLTQAQMDDISAYVLSLNPWI